MTANNLVRTKLNSGLMPAAPGLFQPTAAPPLPALSLDTTLATGAQNWANACSFGHSGTPGRGENIYASAGTPLTPVIAVTDWASESTAYKYAVIGSPLNDPSAVGHYTQLVWANTTLVGCGITHCTTNSPFGAAFPAWDFAVCQYSPPGNFTGQFPYIAGVAPVGGGPLDADGNGRYDALTDGLIIIRYLFGITGPSLTGGVLGAGATVTTPELMLTKLNGLRQQYDIDGNGKVDALTDGLIIIRYLFGVRGASLIAGAIGPTPLRSTALEIEAYILTLMP